MHTDLQFIWNWFRVSGWLKKNTDIFPLHWIVCQICHKLKNHICVGFFLYSLFGPNGLFVISPIPSCLYYYKSFMSLSMWWYKFSKFTLLFQDSLDYLGFLHFHTNFKFRLPMSTRRPAQVLIQIVLINMMNLKELTSLQSMSILHTLLIDWLIDCTLYLFKWWYIKR